MRSAENDAPGLTQHRQPCTTDLCGARRVDAKYPANVEVFVVAGALVGLVEASSCSLQKTNRELVVGDRVRVRERAASSAIHRLKEALPLSFSSLQ